MTGALCFCTKFVPNQKRDPIKWAFMGIFPKSSNPVGPTSLYTRKIYIKIGANPTNKGLAPVFV